MYTLSFIIDDVSFPGMESEDILFETLAEVKDFINQYDKEFIYKPSRSIRYEIVDDVKNIGYAIEGPVTSLITIGDRLVDNLYPDYLLGEKKDKEIWMYTRQETLEYIVMRLQRGLDDHLYEIPINDGYERRYQYLLSMILNMLEKLEDVNDKEI